MGRFERIFISSTCYDLIDIRAELEAQLRTQGLEPILSDSNTSDFSIQPEMHSIETCLANVRDSDCVLVIISQRYGPTLEVIEEGVSATHLEYLEAQKCGKPIIMYVRDRLIGEFESWRKNKGSDLKTSWCRDKNKLKLFEWIEAHKELKPEGRSNWFWTFKDSIDLKKRVAKDLKIHIGQARLVNVLKSGNLPKYACDIIESVSSQRAGLSIQINSDHELGLWQQNALGMLYKLFKGRADDLSVSWLRPKGNGKRTLYAYKATGTAYNNHHEFAEGEGFVGNIWLQNQAEMVSNGEEHEWWQYREGCENSTYICAPVGPFTGSGGVLAIGSNEGFEVFESDLEVVKMFASMLTLGCEEGSVTKRNLKAVSKVAS